MTRRLRWSVPDAPAPRHPYRDSAIVYGIFAVLLVLLAWATGGSIGKAVLVAIAVWIAAMVWSVMRWRQRLRDEARRRELARDDTP
jgi:Flp pilus assembly protein TadB